MEEKKDVTGEISHEVCHSPCIECHGKGYLDNEEICPVCAGSGCKDKKFCEPAGGLGCES